MAPVTAESNPQPQQRSKKLWCTLCKIVGVDLLQELILSDRWLVRNHTTNRKSSCGEQELESGIEVWQTSKLDENTGWSEHFSPGQSVSITARSLRQKLALDLVRENETSLPIETPFSWCKKSGVGEGKSNCYDGAGVSGRSRKLARLTQISTPWEQVDGQRRGDDFGGCSLIPVRLDHSANDHDDDDDDDDDRSETKRIPVKHCEWSPFNMLTCVPPPPLEQYEPNNGQLKDFGVTIRSVEDELQEVAQLGEGSFGRVVLMRHKRLGFQTAVKKVRRRRHASPSRCSKAFLLQDRDLDKIEHQLARELQVLSRCATERNPHVLKCYGVFLRNSDVWIFIEPMHCCLGKLLARGVLVPEPVLGQIAVKLVQALQYLKVEHKFTHCDIKPSNILVSRDGAVKLCDFGLSAPLIDSEVHSFAQGCLQYMAPERFEPYKQFDVRADVWSLGITLMELLLGRNPYADSKSYLQLQEMITDQAAPQFSKCQIAQLALSKDCVHFIHACLVREVARRPKYTGLIKHSFYRKHDGKVTTCGDGANRIIGQWLASLEVPPH